ncbi:MAG: hypothetical protein WBW80_14125 [Acidimicrobiales bacterium]
MVLAALTYVGSAVSLRGAVIPPLPMARTTELQLAEAFTSVATPDGWGAWPCPIAFSAILAWNRSPR